jgi:copper(I)-binding protein
MFNIARRVPGWKRLAVPGIAAGAIAVLGSVAVYAQGTLPLPTPGTTPAPNTAPAPNPAAPGAPTTPPGDAAAKARAAALAAKANVDVTDAWTRATAGNATTAAVYLHLVSAKDPDRLVGVETAAAQKIEVHEDSTQNGVVKMTVLPAVDVPAGGTVNFAPGGKHFMLTGLKAPLKEGDSFLITLSFDKAGTQSTVVKVLGAAANGPPQATTARRGDTTAGVSTR